jgi:hypothetical protein
MENGKNLQKTNIMPGYHCQRRVFLPGSVINKVYKASEAGYAFFKYLGLAPQLKQERDTA